MSTSTGCAGGRVTLVTPPAEVDYASAIATYLTTQHPGLAVDRVDPTTGLDDLPDAGRQRGTPQSDPDGGAKGPDLVIVTGSTARVADSEPWIPRLAGRLARLVDVGQPVLGVCFGHQLLADALGGTVATLPERAAGYRRITATGADQQHPLLRGLGTGFTAFRWHRDHVASLPPDAHCLAVADDGTIQAFALRDAPVFGIQFHPEVDLQDARRLVATHPASTLPKDVRDTLTDAAATRAARARRLYENALRAATAPNSTV